ncbi:hypothetical protein ACH5RR_021783 [Cinchona calisaya]|uniref:Uncharacterized protein n=1 Tax=Cinchona calisaya TaxID=153742 RepID=A0ABD2ZIA2_9GENT
MKDMLQGIDMDYYHHVRDYVNTLLICNPSSHLVLKIHRNSKEDEYVTAIGRDGNNNMFPKLHFVVVGTKGHAIKSYRATGRPTRAVGRPA